MASRSDPVVLVVEEQPLAMLLTVQAFQKAGAKPMVAFTAAEAIDVLEVHDDIGLVCIDWDMVVPENTRSFAQLVRARWSTVEIALSASLAGIDTSDLPLGCRVLMKPIRPFDIRQALLDFGLIGSPPKALLGLSRKATI